MAKQEVFFDDNNLSSFKGSEGEEFTLPLKYRSSDGSGTSGIKLVVYYDSSVLTPVDVSDQLFASLISNNTLGSDLSDSSNGDSDEKTDKYIEFNWADICLLYTSPSPRD